MHRQQRLCIVSRGRANLFGYLTAALMPTDGLEFVVDRRGTRRDAPSSAERAGSTWNGGDRRQTCVESALTSRGWALLARDDASETWVHDSGTPMPASPKRPRPTRTRREWRAFVYVGGAAAAIALVALVGLVVVGGFRLPASFALGGLPAQLINIVR